MWRFVPRLPLNLSDVVPLRGRLTFCPCLSVRLKLLFGLEPILQIPALLPACFVPKLKGEPCNLFVIRLIGCFCPCFHNISFTAVCIPFWFWNHPPRKIVCGLVDSRQRNSRAFRAWGQPGEIPDALSKNMKSSSFGNRIFGQGPFFSTFDFAG